MHRTSFDTLITDCPISNLDDVFPDRVWVLTHKPTNRYGCYCYEGEHGLAVFSTENGAIRFSEWIDLPGMATEEVSFEEAREIAQGRPLPVVAVMLLDDIDSPKIHYVR